VFHIVSFVGRFRGEEMHMLSFDAIAKYLRYEEPKDPALNHVMIALHGRVKGERKAEVCHLIPVAAVAKSGLKPKLWVKRAVAAYGRIGITDGWLFRDQRGAPSRQKEYEPRLFALIDEVIVNESLPERILPRSTDVAAEYGIGKIWSTRIRYSRNKHGYFGPGHKAVGTMEECRKCRGQASESWRNKGRVLGYYDDVEKFIKGHQELMKFKGFLVP
jgi:hypothetical protein